MKDKKYLRKESRTTKKFLLTAKIIAIVTAVVFVFSFSRGTVNAAINKEITNQYQDKELDILKKDVNTSAVSFIGNLINVSRGHLVEQNNVKAYKKLNKSVNNRIKLQKQVDALYDGKKYYRNNVTRKLLDKTDKQILEEKNQDVYQIEKNKLDTIRIWYEQSTDGQRYIDKSWQMFSEDNDSLSTKRISMINTYDKLIKNKQLKKDVTSKVKQMNEYFNSHSRENKKVAAARRSLEELKNSPLTLKYKDANVDIVSSLDQSNDASDELSNAGITAKQVLYLNKSKQQIAYMTMTNGHYVADGGFKNVLASSIVSGQYHIKNILRSSSDAAIITDEKSNNFGKFIDDSPTDDLKQMGIDNADNSIGDYNTANPVFWLKNNPALQTSIYFGNSSTIGFIYADGSEYNNSIKLSSSDLTTIQNKVSSGILIYVK